MSLGEDRVRVTFNPGHLVLVTRIKEKTAELIDICEQCRVAANPGEEVRLWALAQTSYEEAAMWAVKGATSK